MLNRFLESFVREWFKLQFNFRQKSEVKNTLCRNYLLRFLLNETLIVRNSVFSDFITNKKIKLLD